MHALPQRMHTPSLGSLASEQLQQLGSAAPWCPQSSITLHVHGLAGGAAAAHLARVELAPRGFQHVEGDVCNDHLVRAAAALAHLHGKDRQVYKAMLC